MLHLTLSLHKNVDVDLKVLTLKCKMPLCDKLFSLILGSDEHYCIAYLFKPNVTVHVTELIVCLNFEVKNVKYLLSSFQGSTFR